YFIVILEGKPLEGREKNFKQMFEGRRRNVGGLECGEKSEVGRGIFERDENLSYRLHGSTQRIVYYIIRVCENDYVVIPTR
ncbi:hypothetical protein, partial [Chryseobacterium indologenes]|uniref:hypothetical protein n=1 Tax=Chryseobacterium indologenes TaxID=253 RepID=UPI001E326EFC